jgi:NAD(P)-dependent dehydrogenase (short-subunit alcohol dehydrogenase family)
MQQYTVPDQTGRTAVITGATAGIGYWTALGLAKAGAQVVIVARDPAKAAKAQSEIAAKAGGPRPEIAICDLASLRQVDTAARELAQRFPRIDILVNNAGLSAARRELTADGYERTFAVNHLAPFLLTERLLPALEAAGTSLRKARIVTVSSIAARQATIDFANLMGERSYNLYQAYARSKLANLLFTKELARRLIGKPVTANCLHPGVVSTDIATQGIAGMVWGLMRPFMLTPEKGAVNSLFVSTSPAIENVSGEFFARQKAMKVTPLADDAAVTARLWAESERLVAKALGAV